MYCFHFFEMSRAKSGSRERLTSEMISTSAMRPLSHRLVMRARTLSPWIYPDCIEYGLTKYEISPEVRVIFLGLNRRLPVM